MMTNIELNQKIAELRKIEEQAAELKAAVDKKSECKYCKFINEDMPLELDRGRKVTEIRYTTKDDDLFYWGHPYRIPLNFCPNCGAKMVEPQERSNKE